MGVNGVDVQLSPAARKIFNYDIECKCVEKINIWEAIAQARAYSTKGTPMVAFSKNYEDIWVAIPFEKFLELHKDKKNVED